MVIANLSDWLRPDDGAGAGVIVALNPRVGAAGLMIAAAHRDGRFSAMERDRVIALLMKLLHVGNPEAKAVIQEAEDELRRGERGFTSFATAAKELEKDDREALIGHLWRLVARNGEAEGANVLVPSVCDVLGFSTVQAEALRPKDV